MSHSRCGLVRTYRSVSSCRIIDKDPVGMAITQFVRPGTAHHRSRLKELSVTPGIACQDEVLDICHAYWVCVTRASRQLRNRNPLSHKYGTSYL